MIVVDAQVHAAAPGRGSWTAVPSERAGRLCNPEEGDLLAEMGEAGVDAVVLVPPLGPEEVPNNLPWLEMSRRRPQQFAVMGRVLVEEGVSRDTVCRSLREPGMLGLRLSFHRGRGNSQSLTDSATEWVWEVLSDCKVPVMINAPGMMAELGQIAARYPDLSVVVDHLGIDMNTRTMDLRPEVVPVLRLARLPNIAVKASGLPAVSAESYPFPLLKECLRDVVDAFGSSRVFWGSDLSRLPCTYSALVRFFRTQLDFLSQVQLEEIMGHGLIRWLHWPELEGRLEQRAYSQNCRPTS